MPPLLSSTHTHFHTPHFQTDPNWGNFLYEEGPEVPASEGVHGSGVGGKLHLIDFGAAREFPPGFVKDYLEMVKVGPGRTWMDAV